VERFAFCLLDAGASDRQTGLRALEGKRLNRLLRRAGVGAALGEKEAAIVEEIAAWMQAWRVDPEGFAARGRDIFERLLRGEPVEQTESQALCLLLRREAESLRERVNWLSENADPYNMKTMARILPRLRIYDEGVHEALRLADKIESGGPVGETRLSLEAHLKEAGFAKWLKHLKEADALRHWVLALEMQREKRVPTMDLIALSTLGRYVLEARGEKNDPVAWILLALRSFQDGGFSLEAGQTASVLRPGLISMGIKVFSTRIEGDFRQRTYTALIGKDLLTRSYSQLADDGAVDMKALLTQNMGRDSVLESLLNNPKVYQTPGLVEYVAGTCRSSALLSRIAKLRHLHTGHANRGVPLALLLNPTNFPVSLLRTFINTRYVGMVDLRRLARTRSGIRPDVRKEVEAYVEKHG
jgi:hypothetical protein